VDRCGTADVVAVDPSPPFVEAARARLPGVDVRLATAEDLPFADDTFDLCLAQLVVHFMTDPVAGLREMGRVARPGARVGASVWDHTTGTGPLSPFWSAARDVDPSAPGEAELAGSREGHLVELAEAAGLVEVTSTSLTVRVSFATFDDWWAPYLLGVGTTGDYVATVDEERRRAIERRCRETLPPAPFEQDARAWVVLARAS
jgi:SAM-dependent methyltransferase